MIALARQAVKEAAQKAGLNPDKVYELVAADNLTIKRPYMTIQFLPATYRRTGRKLGVWREEKKAGCGIALQAKKLELYEAELEIAVNVLANDEEWLGDFCYGFVQSLPRGINDKRGNWVKIRAQEAQFSKPKDKRVGEKVIEVFKKRDQLFALTFTGRITVEEREELIRHFSIETYWKGQSYGNQHD